MVDIRIRSKNADQNQAIIDEIALSVFVDMKIISKQDFEKVKGDAAKQIKLLQSVEDLKGKKEIDFAERFIDKILSNEEDYLDCVPPYTLALAYTKTKDRLENTILSDDKREHLQKRLEKVTNRIDSLINDFAQNIGYHFVDTTNIADVYSGYNKMFDAREADLPEDSTLRQQINDNRTALDIYIKDYDSQNGISEIAEKEEDVETIEKNYDAATKVAAKWKPSEATLRSASKYQFLDDKGKAKPQFVDEEGSLVFEYEEGCELYDKGELNSIIGLVQHDFALRHIKDAPVSNVEDVEDELNEDVTHKLFELDTAEKFASGCIEDPKRFTDPDHFKKFVAQLNTDGGSISHEGYECAMDAQVNKTAGFAGRVKQKLGKFGDKATNFFGKVFKPIQKIDKRADDRIQGQSRKDKREKRIEFFKRMLKGFGCAFLVSTTITLVASAAASIAGIGLAASLATIGILSAVIMGGIQIHKWRKARREAGQDASIKAMLQDKRMLMTLGTSAIASIALVFGATGVTAAAATLGYGALALGASNNAISTYQDAKKAGMGKGESIAWALANAAMVVAGGFAGRFAGRYLADSMGLSTRTETHQEYKKVGEHEETETTYKPETLENAERIAKMWYRDNPDLLQQRVDMVNDYNATHGTNIDPYRAVMLNADAGGMTADNMALHVDGGGVVHSHGQHTVLTQHWGSEHGTSTAELNALRHMFDGGQISDDAMNAAMKIDQMVSPINEVGVTTGAPVHHDHVLKPLNVDLGNGERGYSTYANGNSPMEVNTKVVDDYGYVDVTTQTHVDAPGLMGTFGNYNKEHQASLKDRHGAKADKITEIVPPKKPKQIEGKQTPVQVGYNKPEQKQIGYTEPEQKQISGKKTPLQLGWNGRTEPKEKHLFITYEDAKNINLYREKIVKIKEKLAASDSKKQSEKLKSKKDTFVYELNEILNRYGDPYADVLADAMQWAYKRDELKDTETQLAKEQEFITTGKKKSEIDAHEETVAKLQDKISRLKSEIPADDTFYHGVPVQYNHVEEKQTEAEQAKEDNKKHADEIHAEQSKAQKFNRGKGLVKKLNDLENKNEQNALSDRIIAAIGKDNFAKIDKDTLTKLALFDLAMPNGLPTNELIEKYIKRYPQDIDIFHQNGVKFVPGKSPVNMRRKGGGR